MSTRTASHAGSWYHASKSRLTQDLEGWLTDAHQPNQHQDWRAVPTPSPLNHCRAIIAPHAGYSYSGSAAAWAYKLIDPSSIKRVFILGPSHHVYLDGCAVSKCTEYETPIGNLKIDKNINQELFETGSFDLMSLQTDEDEHSIELHLPYIRHVFKNHDITIVPILVGSITSKQEREYGALLAPYLADRDNFFVISSDFCHWGTRFSYTYYQDSTSEEEATKPNKSSSEMKGESYPIYRCIEELDRRGMESISKEDAETAHQSFTRYLRETKNTICGRHPIGILLGCLIHLHLQNHNHHHVLKFVRYQQSSPCLTIEDSSVSYASAFLQIPIP